LAALSSRASKTSSGVAYALECRERDRTRAPDQVNQVSPSDQAIQSLNLAHERPRGFTLLPPWLCYLFSNWPTILAEVEDFGTWCVWRNKFDVAR